MRKGQKATEETKKKISEGRKGKLVGKDNPFYGKKHSDESKAGMSKNHAPTSGVNSPSWKGGKVIINCRICGKGRSVYQSDIDKGGGKFCSISCNSINNHLHQKQKGTDIERLIEDELIRREIPYTKQVPLLGITIVDFLLPHDTVIYADGEYWHKKEGKEKRAVNQDFMLTFHGYRVFRFWGKDIKESPKKCVGQATKGFWRAS
jgi:very-short-patch-repair endonuclease